MGRLPSNGSEAQRSFSLSLDPRDLNSSMKSSHHLMETADEVTSHLQGANTFGILDAKRGFLAFVAR